MASGKLIVLAGLIVAIMIVAIALSGSVRIREMSLGPWTDPVQVYDQEIIWGDTSGTKMAVYGWDQMIVSTDAGTSWSSPRSTSGMIEIVGDVMYRASFLAPYTDRIYFSKSVDDGVTWSSAVEVIVLTSWGDYCFGIFMLNSVLFVYAYDGDGTIKVSNSTDDGVSWSSQVIVDHDIWMTDPHSNDMVYVNGKIYMAYWNETATPEGTEIIVIESSDMGATWENRQVVAIPGYCPFIKADMDVLYLTYFTYNGGVHLFFTKSAEGTIWSTPIEVGGSTNGDDPVSLSSLAVSVGRIFVAYLDYDAIPSNVYRLHINSSEDDGATWQDMGDVTSQSTNAELPVLLICDESLHFFWVDMGTGDWTGGPYPTYYRSALLGPPIPEFGAVIVPVMMTVFVLGLWSAMRKPRQN